jgi:hypothetical protein
MPGSCAVLSSPPSEIKSRESRALLFSGRNGAGLFGTPEPSVDEMNFPAGPLNDVSHRGSHCESKLHEISTFYVLNPKTHNRSVERPYKPNMAGR